MIPMIEKILFLKGVDLFTQIPAHELSPIAEISDEVHYAKGQSIFQEGEEGDALYVIVEGSVKVHRADAFLAALGEGQFFGEMAILDAEPRSASVTAESSLVLLRISRADFSELLDEKPEISRGILLVLTRRLRAANRHVGTGGCATSP